MNVKSSLLKKDNKAYYQALEKIILKSPHFVHIVNYEMIESQFDEIMYVLMCGTGVGFSVESKYTNKLPEVPEELHPTDTAIVFADSKIGWATGYREFISLLYS